LSKAVYTASVVAIADPLEWNSLTDANIALLIDYENVGGDSMQSLVEQLSGMGRIIVKRAYADWSTQRKGQERLIELGVEAVHNYRGTRAGKNSCDIKLTIDAVELLHSAQVDTFVIVSSDSDFVPLVNHLRGSGKSVVGAGRRAVTSTTMVKSCDRYIFLGTSDTGTDDYERNRTTRTPRRNERSRRPLEPSVPSNGAEIAATSEAVTTLLTRAIEATMDDNGNALGTRLAQTMTRIDPSFSYRDAGYRSFREFLMSRDEISVTTHQGTDFTVSLKSPDITSMGPSNGNLSKPSVPGTTPRIINPPVSNTDNDSDYVETTDNIEVQTDDEELPNNWEDKVDSAWNDREKDRISGPSAATEAAKILGFKRLRDSIFPTLDNLLDASKLLKSNWSRNRNYVEKKK